MTRLHVSRRLLLTLAIITTVCGLPAAAGLVAPAPVVYGQNGISCGGPTATVGISPTATITNTPNNVIFVDFSQREYFVSETDVDQVINVPVVLNKTPSSGNTVTVSYTLGAGGDTASGADYTDVTPVPGTLVFTSTNSSQNINIQITGDNTLETSEFLTLTLINAASSDAGTPAQIKTGSNANNPSRLTIIDDDAGATATASPTITSTATTAATATGAPTDGCEPNNDADSATFFSVGALFANMTLAPPGDEDWFKVQVKNGHAYEAETTVATGLDTVMYIYSDAGGTLVDQNDDKSINDLGSKVNFIANKDDFYYVRIINKDPSDPAGKTYSLSIREIVSLGACVSASSPLLDQCEPNNDSGSATAAVTGVPYPALTLAPSGDVDWFRVVVKADSTYRADITIQDAGLDTFAELYTDPNAGSVLTSDDKATGDPASLLTWTAALDGTYYIKVSRKDNGIDPAGKKYTLTVTETGQGPDVYEPNYDFNTATLVNAITPGSTGVEGNGVYTSDFYPWHEATVDNDFYKLNVKAGFVYDCQTSNLTQATDTNLIAYDAAFNAIGGNDDIAPTNLASRFVYTAVTNTVIYFVIGHNGNVPLDQAKGRSYKFSCASTFFMTPTPTATTVPVSSGGGGAGPGPITIIITATPPPTTPTPGVTPTPPIGIRPLSTPAAGGGSAAPRLVVVDLLVYYDANGNNVPNSGEGVSGLSAELQEVSTGRLIGQGFTDASGLLHLTATATGKVRLVVPFIGFSQVISGDAETVIVRIESRPLPESIP